MEVIAKIKASGGRAVVTGVEGSGYGFRVIQTIFAAAAEQPTTFRMQPPVS